jgi:hypothetical protein
MNRFALTILLAAVGLAGCTAQDSAEQAEPTEPVVLGPVDGRDLPAVDLERVQVGDLAPDFSLASLAGPVETLSDFRGTKNVILVFYRGYW